MAIAAAEQASKEKYRGTTAEAAKEERRWLKKHKSSRVIDDEEEEEAYRRRRVYLGIQIDEGSCMYWLRFDISFPKMKMKMQMKMNSDSDSEFDDRHRPRLGEPQVLTKVKVKRAFVSDSMFALDASTGSMYCVGGTRKEDPGDHSRDAKVVSLDSNNNIHHQNLSPMLLRRASGAAIVVGGVLYVFGGNRFETPRSPWAERVIINKKIYTDSNSNELEEEWQALPDPPEPQFSRLPKWAGANPFALSFGGEDDPKILVGHICCTRDHLLIYNIINENWTILSFPPPLRIRMDVNPILVDDTTLYWLEPKYNSIHAFEFNQGNHALYSAACRYSLLREGLRDYARGSSPLMHLGGMEFCFFYSTYDDDHLPAVYYKRFILTKCRRYGYNTLDISSYTCHRVLNFPDGGLNKIMQAYIMNI